MYIYRSIVHEYPSISSISSNKMCSDCSSINKLEYGHVIARWFRGQ